MNKNRLVKLAVFKSQHIAEDFADACRSVGKVACTIPVWKRREFDSNGHQIQGYILGFSCIVGYEVKWADNWQCFDLEG